MAKVALPLQDRIAQTSQVSMSERYISVQFGDGYGQHARDGINGRQTNWSVTWDGLTSSEAITLRETFSGLGGASVIEWQSPLSSQPETFMVTEHSAAPAQSGGPYWSYSATLQRRFGSFDT